MALPLFRNRANPQYVLEQAAFYASLTHSLVLDKGIGSSTYTNTSVARSVQDNEGILRTAIAGEARFVGARRVRNLVVNEALTVANYVNSANVTSVIGQSDPDGGTSAYAITATAGNGSLIGGGGGFVTGNTYISSVYLKRLVGTGTVQLVTPDGVWTTVTVTSSWTRVSIVSVRTGSTGYFGVRCVTSGDSVAAYHPQIEDITGRTDQTTPSEYVSVGALDYRSTQDPLYLSLPGTAGHSASTPDSTAVSTIVDIDVRAELTAVDWTPAAFTAVIGTDPATGTPNRTWALWWLGSSDGKLSLQASIDGSAANLATSSVGTGITDGLKKWVRVTRVDATGVTKFYTSDDGSTWTQLGADVATTAGAIFDSASKPCYIGNLPSGGSPFNGKVHQAQVYSNGSLAVDFNPQRDATTPTGTITSSTTGEVWTINGASSVVRNAAYHGAGVDGVKYFNTDLTGAAIPAATNLGFLSEAAATNLCLQSNAFTTTWTAYLTPAPTQNVVGPDGATSAWTLTDNDAGDVEEIYQDITLTAAAYTLSVFVKKTVGATTFPALRWFIPGLTQCAACTIDTNNGVATAWTAMTAFTMASGMSASCVSYNTDYWRVSLTKTGTVAAHRVELFPAVTSNATQSTGAFSAAITGSAVFYGAQVELGSAATSYIPTTTVAVTRNADVLTYPSAGNISDTAGTTYLEMSFGPSVLSSWQGIAVAAGAGWIPYGATGGVVRQFDGNNIAEVTPSPALANITTKMSASWGTNQRLKVGTVTAATSTFDGSMNSGAAIGIGCTPAGASQPNAAIRNARIWLTQKSTSEQASITR